MQIRSNPLDFDVEDDTGRSWGLDVNHDGSLTLYAHGLTEDSDARYREDQYAPSLEIEIKPDQAGEFMAALGAWFDQLPTSRAAEG